MPVVPPDLVEMTNSLAALKVWLTPPVTFDGIVAGVIAISSGAIDPGESVGLVVAVGDGWFSLR